MTPDAPLLLENAIAAKLSELGARVRLFADVFKKDGVANQRVNVMVGHSSSEYQWSTDYPVVAGVEVASFEIRVESADVKNHQAAFAYLGAGMELLRGYEPLTSVKPIIPFRYAPNGYDVQAGTWAYTGIVRAQIMRPGDYQLIADIPPIEGITIGIYRGEVLQRTILQEVNP